MNGHTRHLRRALSLAASMVKAQYTGEQVHPLDLARLFCALQLAGAGFPPDVGWTWSEAGVNERILTSIEVRRPCRAFTERRAP